MVGRAAAFLVVVMVGRAVAADCNQNDVPDREDMESGTSADCNGNLVPDECDLRNENYWLRLESPVFGDIDPGSLLFTDLNGDYLPDATAVPLESSSVAVRLRVNDYDEVRFEEETRLYAVPPSPSVLAADDMNADGRKDLIVGHRGSPEVSIMLGAGEGAFSSPRKVPVPANPTAILLVELDGELGPEVVVLGTAPASISILWNRGFGLLEGAILYALPAREASSRASALASGDFDADGDVDLLVAGADDAPAQALWNLRSRDFRLNETTIRGESLLALDLESDGDSDVAASGPTASRVYRSLGNGFFTLSGEFFLGKSPGDLAVGSHGAGWSLAAAGDRIGVLTTHDEVAFTPWRIAELFGSGEEIGPFLSLVSASGRKGELLAVIGGDGRNEASVLSLFRALGGGSRDCNGNGIPDECDIASGEEDDCNANGWADSCEADCNGNGVQDRCDIDAGSSADCNRDRTPDECRSWDDGREDTDGDGILDHCDPDNPYELRFTGPTNLRLVDGVPNADFLVELGAPVGRGIVSFSYGVRSEGCTIETATIAGTALSGLPLTLAGVRPGTELPDRTEPCIWAAAYDWRDPPLFDGGGGAHVILRLTVACPRIDGAPCSSGTLGFSPTCSYTGQAQCVIDLEGESRWPLLTPASFTICLGDFRRGDANADGKVDISDGIRTVMFLFLGAGPPPCLDAADATDDGALDISDAIRILMDFFIPQDTDIPPPGPFECGADPSPDDLGCDSSGEC